MAEPKVRDTAHALLVFADIIDSSKFSSVLGFEDYARRVIEFQQLFRSLGNRYFPRPEDKTIGFTQIDARGDEGTVFCIEHRLKERADLVFRAIEFLYHLKGRLYFGLDDRKEDTRKLAAPLRMGIGAGIHVGPVAYATEVRENRSEIVRIEGFSINKAKRVESSSRGGTFSQIILSKEAARLLDGEPVLFSPITASMKGVEEHAELHEVRAGLFSGLKLDRNDPADQRLINRVSDLADHPDQMDEAWVKSLIVSVLDVLLESSMVTEHRTKYRKQQLNIAWHSSIEDDPILLYLRAKDYQEQQKSTQRIRYLRQILERHPDFVFAKKRMVQACWKVALQDKERSERVYARDVAEEFLNRFSNYLSEDEKHEFAEIVNEAGKKAE